MKPSQTRAQKWTRVIYTLVLLSFILPVGYLIYRLIFWDEAAAQALERTRADYALMLLQCLLGIVVIHLPTFLTRRFRFELPAALYIMYILFLYGAIFLGEVRSFYYTVPLVVYDRDSDSYEMKNTISDGLYKELMEKTPLEGERMHLMQTFRPNDFVAAYAKKHNAPVTEELKAQLIKEYSLNPAFME